MCLTASSAHQSKSLIVRRDSRTLPDQLTGWLISVYALRKNKLAGVIASFTDWAKPQNLASSRLSTSRLFFLAVTLKSTASRLILLSFSRGTSKTPAAVLTVMPRWYTDCEGSHSHFLGLAVSPNESSTALIHSEPAPACSLEQNII